MVSSIKYLGLHISRDFTWTINTATIIKKAHQHLCFLRRLKWAGLDALVLTAFYWYVAESILTSSITVWYGSCSTADRKVLQTVIKSAQNTVHCSLPSTEDTYISRCRTRASSSMDDPTHPAHGLFEFLPSGRRLRRIKARTTKLKSSFLPEAVRIMNPMPL